MMKLPQRMAWALSIVGLLAAAAPAATITYTATDIADDATGDRWRYDYTVSGYFAADQGFTVYFDHASYSDLGPGQAGLDTNATLIDLSDGSSAWDLWIAEPAPGLSQDGFFDAYALVDGADVNGPFRVAFTWLGLGSPGGQGFEVYQADPTTGALQSLGGGTSSVIPEPTTLLLLGTGLLGVVGLARKKQTRR